MYKTNWRIKSDSTTSMRVNEIHETYLILNLIFKQVRKPSLNWSVYLFIPAEVTFSESPLKRVANIRIFFGQASAFYKKPRTFREDLKLLLTALNSEYSGSDSFQFRRNPSSAKRVILTLYESRFSAKTQSLK